MDKKAEFAQAQTEYKEVKANLEKLRIDSEAIHKKLIAEVANHKIRPLETVKPFRQSQTEIDKAEQEHRKATYKLWGLLNTNFEESANEIAAKNLPKDEFYDQIANLHPKDLKHLNKKPSE